MIGILSVFVLSVASAQVMGWLGEADFRKGAIFGKQPILQGPAQPFLGQPVQNLVPQVQNLVPMPNLAPMQNIVPMPNMFASQGLGLKSGLQQTVASMMSDPTSIVAPKTAPFLAVPLFAEEVIHSAMGPKPTATHPWIPPMQGPCGLPRLGGRLSYWDRLRDRDRYCLPAEPPLPPTGER